MSFCLRRSREARRPRKVFLREGRLQIILALAVWAAWMTTSKVAYGQPGPPVACCLPDASCVNTLHNDCVARGGDPLGPGSDCAALLTACSPLKWSQPPTFNPASAHPECFWGWDELSWYGGFQIVADDWRCTTDQPVTDIHWWGSYKGWTGIDPPAVVPDRFHIGLWTDVPFIPPGFSHPGFMFRQWIVLRAQLGEHAVACDFHPDFMAAPDGCFRYDFKIPQAEWFYQEPACSIYWVSISAIYPVQPSMYPWGWKTREHFFMDDAVRILAPTAPVIGQPYVMGEPIEDISGNSWDMAFVITTEPACRPMIDGSACELTICPNVVETCVPISVRCPLSGPCTIIDCNCQPGGNCHVDLDAGGAPICVGGCPQGKMCISVISPQPDGSTIFKCECVPQPEACCFPDGHCEMQLAANCLVINGTPQGPGTTCSLLQEACCLANGTCMMTDPLCCDDLGGTKMGPGSQCTALEACCFAPPNPFCVKMDPLCCVAQGGTPGGAGSTCTPEACCLPDGTCTTMATCLCTLLGGTPKGPGTACTGLQACCKTDGTCADLDPLCCVQQGGEPKGTGTSCANTTCAVPTQACCLPNGTCKDLEYNRCVALGGNPQGPNTTCMQPTIVCNPLKWAQPPTYSVAAPGAQCFWGWDDPSNYLTGPIVADDWACSSNQPITDIHWWGSYQNWTTRTPPPQGLGPDLFHIGIWRDVPANVDRPFSHPGKMIWQWIVPRQTANEQYVGCDEYPGMPSDICFRYDFTVPNSAEWFYQQPSVDPTVYWISISAIYMLPPMQYPWGWKTREHFFNDDAVRIFNPVAPGVGASFVDGLPIETLDGKSWDMAFVLTTRRQAGVKWEQWPNPGLPGLHAHDGITLADNWECSGGKVTDFHWWGNYELGDLGQEERGAGIQCINLSIHRNRPDQPWCLPQEPAEWGVCALFSALHERDTGLRNSEGSKIYLYDFYLPDGFAQLQGDIYWLDIEAQSTNPQDPALWRWQENGRNAVPRLCPAAQRSMPPPPFMWQSITWPDDPPLYSEMAFRVTSRPYPPGPDPTGVDKTRFISVAPGNAGQSTALMVTLTSLHHVDPPYTGGTATDFTAWEGEVRWVGPPQQYRESDSDPTQFMASKLQCEPYYRDWVTVSLLHVTGAEIVPSSLYDVQAVSIACQGAETGCADVSSAPRIGTTRWGDVWPAYNPPDPSDQPDFDDISGLVNKFKSLLGAPIKARALLAGQAPDMVPDLSFDHISDCVDAFKGRSYPYPGPCGCPSSVPCNQTSCTTPEQCGGGTCIAGFCRDACERCAP